MFFSFLTSNSDIYIFSYDFKLVKKSKFSYHISCKNNCMYMYIVFKNGKAIKYIEFIYEAKVLCVVRTLYTCTLSSMD